MTKEIQIQSAISPKALRLQRGGEKQGHTRVAVLNGDRIFVAGVELNEDGIRDLVQWAIGSYGSQILYPPVKPVEPIHLSASEHNKQEFAKIPVGMTFTLGYHAYQTERLFDPLATEALVKVSDTEYELLDKSWSTKRHSIRGWSLWYRTFTWTDTRSPEQVIVDHNIAEFAKLPIGATFEATAIGRVPDGVKKVITGTKVTEDRFDYHFGPMHPVPSQIKGWNAIKRTWVETTPNTGAQISALATGDQFTVVYPNGTEHKGIKISEDQWFCYTDKMQRHITRDGGATKGTVTKS